MAVVLVLGIVAINVTSGILLKILASNGGDNRLLLVLGFGTVFVLNGARLVVWLFANRHFPLSTIYPLTSLFFPVMLVVSYAYGDPITVSRLLGTLLITFGVFWLGWRINL